MPERPRVVPLDAAPVGPEAVVGLWLGEGALAAEEAERRADEVLMVALDATDAVVGVSSAYLRRSAQLGLVLWHVRVYVARDHRRGELAVDLARESRDHLRARWVDGSDPRASGMLFEVQATVLKRHVPQAVWRRTDFAFVGETPGGAHLRVSYFPGAVCPPPPVVAGTDLPGT